jgi:hypothetical protein
MVLYPGGARSPLAFANGERKGDLRCLKCGSYVSGVGRPRGWHLPSLFKGITDIVSEERVEIAQNSAVLIGLKGLVIMVNALGELGCRRNQAVALVKVATALSIGRITCKIIGSSVAALDDDADLGLRAYPPDRPVKVRGTMEMENVREMDFTKPLKGFVYVEPEDYVTQEDLAKLISMGNDFTSTLQPKEPKAKRQRKAKNSDSKIWSAAARRCLGSWRHVVLKGKRGHAPALQITTGNPPPSSSAGRNPAIPGVASGGRR